MSLDPKPARWFQVVSAECEAVDVILDDGTGPLEQWRDHRYVRATTPDRAKALAVRAWRREFRTFAQRRGRYYLRDENPFRGMTVTPGFWLHVCPVTGDPGCLDCTEGHCEGCSYPPAWAFALQCDRCGADNVYGEIAHEEGCPHAKAGDPQPARIGTRGES